MENNIRIRRIKFSTESFLSLAGHVIRGVQEAQNEGSVIGGLQGKREGDLVYVINTLPMKSGKKDSASSLKRLVRDLKEHRKKGSGVEIVGWYSSSSGTDVSGSPVIRGSHEDFQTIFPGSFLVLVDPAKMERNTRIQDYLAIYHGSEKDIPDADGPSEAPDIDVDLDLSKIVKRIWGIIGSADKISAPKGKRVVIKKRSPGGKINQKKKETEPVSSDPLVMMDRISRDILKLKGYLAKLKRESVRKEHEDRTWFTKRIRFLKMKQIALFDDINAQISRTTDIQMRIAFYKVRDSLAQDMKLLDDLISEQYMETLTDLVRMGAEKSD